MREENLREKTLRNQLTAYGKKVVEAGLVQGTWGNLSVRLNQRFMLVTPSAMDYSRLGPEDMVRVEIRSLRYEGSLKPTSEMGIHGGIYSSRADIGAVIHTHAKYCAVFAAARRDVPVEGELTEIFGSTVKLGAYGPPGSRKLCKNTLKALGNRCGCLMANHGMVCTGADLKEAFDNCCRLEAYCRQYIDSRYRKG